MSEIILDSIIYNDALKYNLSIDLNEVFRKYQDRMDTRKTEITYIVNKLVERDIPSTIKELNNYIYAKGGRKYVSNSTEGNKGSVSISKIN